jgi:diguanylate cyclase (GGDEF)-like protein
MRTRADDAPALPSRPTLGELAAQVPGLREELGERARSAGLLVALVAALILPAWTFVDRQLAPEQASTFLVIRLLGDIPMLLVGAALWRLPIGRRRPERLTFTILAMVQVEVAWMIARVDEPSYYLLGFTLSIFASGCILITRPRWTAYLIAVSWAALGLSVVTAPEGLSTADLVGTAVHLGSTSVVSMLAHVRRYALNNRELTARVRLEREQERSRVLLTQLERLSHEDALTGLANRRRWDAQLETTCAEARQRGSAVGVLLLDIDHFKKVNDRHGHAGGDDVLCAVADLLRSRVRAGDLVARLGGDELAVLMPGADVDRAVELAERLRQEAAALQLPGFEPGELSLSLGVAAAAGARVFPLELTAQADSQLYRAKITRNSVGAPQQALPVS